MFRLTIKNLLARKFRLVTTGFAVLLGVAFMAGSLVLTDTIGKTFDNLFADVFAGTDAYVRAEEPFDAGLEHGGGEGIRPLIAESLVDVVAGVDGVALAEPDIFGFAQIVDKEGDPIGNPGAGAPTFGGNWVENQELNAFRLAEGRAPRREDEVVIDAHAADLGDFVVGDRATVLTQGGAVDVRISGIVRFGEVDSPGGATFVGFTKAAAQDHIGEPGKLNGVTVLADEGVSEDEIRDRIASVLPADHEAITGDALTEENQENVDQMLGFFSQFMLTFAAIALFVGSFIIYNTFTILVAQRTREMALLRAIGASRGQVSRAVLLEALVVGVLAALFGLVVGVGVAAGLKALLGALGLDIPATGLVLTQNTVIVSLVVGVVVSMLAAWLPARRGAKVPPIAAMRDVAIEHTTRVRLRLGIGAAVTALGVVSLFRGLGGGDNALLMVGIGALLTLCGVIIFGPLVARRAAALLGAPLVTTRGMAGALARENAMRNPKRTSSTAAALLIGVAIVGFITVAASSVKASIDKTFNERFTGDFVLNTSSFGFGGVSPRMGEELGKLDELAAVSPLRFSPVQFDGEATMINAIDASEITPISDLEVTEGSLEDLDVNGVAISTEQAEDEGWRIGTKVPVVWPATGAKELTVQVIYDVTELAGEYFVDTAAFDANVEGQFDAAVFAAVAEGTTIDEARRAIEPIADEYANVKIQDREEFVDAQASTIDPLLYLVYALLGLAIIIALFGIANTLALSIVERTRELGLLRAVGMTRPQLRTMVRWEAVIISVFGTLGGLGVGVFFGWAMVQALAEEGFTAFSIPVTQLIVITLIAALAGVVAAALPARRAARLDVLQAIATE